MHDAGLPRAASPRAAPSSPGSLPLEALLERAGTGDRRAFAEVYDATASHAYGIALSVTCDRSQAADVVQEAYLDVWRTSARFDPRRGSGAGWVLTIVHGRAVDRVRSTKSRSDGAASASDAQVAGPVRPTPEGRRVQLALSQVPSPDRRAVELAYFGGYTHAEIAHMTGMPTDAAKSRIREGLMTLRDAMRANGNGAASLTSP